MASEKTKWWKTPPYSNIVGGLSVLIIASVAKTIYDWYTKTEIISTFKDFAIFVSDSFLSLVNFQLRLWWLFCLLPIYVVWQAIKKYSNNQQEATDEEGYTNADWDRFHKTWDQEQIVKYNKEKNTLAYTADKFLNYTWEWQWIRNTKLNIYEVKYLKVCCPNPSCDHYHLKLTHEYVITAELYCGKCYKNQEIQKVSINKLEDYIMAEIMEKVEAL